MKKDSAKIEKYCALCEHSQKSYFEESYLCEKKGIVSAGHVCRKFSYDPQKRVPTKIRFAQGADELSE